MAEALALGPSVAKIARVHGLNGKMIFGWRKAPQFQPTDKKRKAIEAARADADSKPVEQTSDGPAFLSIKVVTPATQADPAKETEALPKRETGSSLVSFPPPPSTFTVQFEWVEPAEVGEVPSHPDRIELVLANWHRQLLSGDMVTDAVLRLTRGPSE